MGNITSIGPLLEGETIDGSKVFHKATPSLLTTYKEKIYAKEKDLKYRLCTWMHLIGFNGTKNNKAKVINLCY